MASFSWKDPVLIGKQRVLGLIPARGGSKRLPRKNVLDFAGKPLIAWTIEAALGSTAIDRVVLSSDDEEIVAAALAAGCEVPFRRPAELANDTATSADVVRHALSALGERYDYLVLLQPTSPLRLSSDIDDCLAGCVEMGGQSSVSVSPLGKPKTYFGAISNGLFEAEDFFREKEPCVLNGAIYVVKVDNFLKTGLFVDQNTRAFLMPSHRSIDIDDAVEFAMAEAIMLNRSRAAPVPVE